MILALANVDKIVALDQVNTDALRLIVEQASGEVVLSVFEMTGGLGLLPDLAAVQTQARNLDY